MVFGFFFTCGALGGLGLSGGTLVCLVIAAFLWPGRKPNLLIVITGWLAGVALAEKPPPELGQSVVMGRIVAPITERNGRSSFFVRGMLPGWVVGARAQVAVGELVVVLGEVFPTAPYRGPGAAPLDARPTWRLRATALQSLAEGSAFWRAASRVQREASQRLQDAAAGHASLALLPAMVVGDRRALDEARAGPLRRAGLAHVLAVSGLHLSALALVVFTAIRALCAVFLRLHAVRTAALCAGLAVVFFAALTGGRVATVRAMWVSTLVLGGVLVGRRCPPKIALACAAVAVVIGDPFASHGPSFQLSFAACAALLWAASSRGGAIRTLLSASLVSTLATAPLTALWFGEIAWFGVVSNLAVVPLVTVVIVPGALLGLVIGVIWPAAGQLVLYGVSLAVELVYWLASLCVRIAEPLSVARPSHISMVALTLFILWALFSITRQQYWRGLAGVVLSMVVLLVPPCVARQGAEKRGLTVWFVDVGQGDSAIIEFPNGAVWLIDGGGAVDANAPSPGERAVLPALRVLGIRALDVVISSHPHPDHIQGLLAVAKAMPIGQFWTAEVPQPASLLGRLANIVRSRGGIVVRPELFHHYTVGEATALVLHPQYKGRAAARPESSANDNSLVVVIEYQNRRIAFLGDIEEEAELELARRLPSNFSVDVVKVAHHGSNTSSRMELMSRLSPELAIISCGLANRFRFPHAAPLAVLRAIGARVMRTDQLGTIQLSIRPNGLIDLAGAH